MSERVSERETKLKGVWSERERERERVRDKA